MQKYLLVFFLVLISFRSTSQEKTNITFKSANGSNEKAEQFLKQLQIEYRGGKYEAHKAYSDSLYVIAKENGFTKYQILGMVNQAVYHNNHNEQDTSVLLYRNALDLCDFIPEDYRTKIIVLVNLGNVYYNIDAYEKGISTMKEVLFLLDKLENNQKIKAAAYLGLSSNYEALKDYDNTIKYLFEAKKVALEMNDESSVAAVLNNLSDAYYNNKEYEKALKTGKEALQLSDVEKLGKDNAWRMYTLGRAEGKLGNFETALAYLHKAQKIATTANLIDIEMHSYESLSEIYAENKNTEQAKVYRNKYLLLQNKFLSNQKEATKLDLKKDLDAKDVLINSNETALSTLLEDKSKLIFWSVLIGLTLAVILFFTIRQKKQQELESKKLRKQLIHLKESAFLEPTSKNIPAKEESKNIQYKNSSLTPEDHLKYKQKLLALMNDKKPYVDYNLNQANLASQLEISSHHLSEVLRFGFEQNFYNFINSYRILEAQKLMEDKAFSDAKIIAIAFDSGFKSKTSFNRVFKEHTGMTPSEYKKKHTS